MGDIAHDGLAALVDGDALNIHVMLAFAAIALQRVELSDIGAGETVQRLLVCSSLVNGTRPSEPRAPSICFRRSKTCRRGCGNGQPK